MPLQAAAALSADQLVAWCADCRSAGERVARQKADDERAAATADAQTDLFTLMGEAVG